MKTETSQAVADALPAWRVVLGAIGFRPKLWLIDLAAVFLVRMLWQVVPGLVMRAFFDLLSGETDCGYPVRKASQAFGQ